MWLQKEIAPDHPLVATIVERFFAGQTAISIKQESQQPVGFCYSAVRRTIRNNGGTAQLCYAISYWPDLFVEALHHAVWRTPSGDLLDVTEPAYQNIKPGLTTIVMAPETEPLGKADPCVPSRFHLLSRNRLVKAYTDATLSAVAIKQRLGEASVKAGGQLVPTGDGSICGYAISAPVPRAVERLQRAHQKAEKEILDTKAALENKFGHRFQ